MPKLIICKGLPASGKSTWAKAYVKTNPNAVRINRDELRLMLKDVQFDPKIENIITVAQDVLLSRFLERRNDVVLDNTNLNPKYWPDLESLAYTLGVEVEWKDFTHVPLSECIERDRKRGAQSVGKKVIERMWRQFLREDPPPPVYVDGKPDAIICDIDGTLALMGDRSPYDASTADQDRLNEPVADIVRTYIQQGYVVLYCSGRDEKFRELTERWLDKFGLNESGVARLLMRPTGDNREDSIIKQELYAKYIIGNYNVRFCLDDRDRVVNAWRDLGLTCLQVNYGDF